MEKITDKLAALPPDGRYFSLEFFPPKTQMVRNARLPFAVPFADLASRASPTSRTVWSAWPAPFVRCSSP